MKAFSDEAIDSSLIWYGQLRDWLAGVPQVAAPDKRESLPIGRTLVKSLREVRTIDKRRHGILRRNLRLEIPDDRDQDDRPAGRHPPELPIDRVKRGAGSPFPAWFPGSRVRVGRRARALRQTVPLHRAESSRLRRVVVPGRGGSLPCQ